MSSTLFLYDTFDYARRALQPERLASALCTAIRLGKHALVQERQAAFLIPLVEAHQEPLQEMVEDEYLKELISLCVRRPDESSEQLASRILKSSNLSAIRLVLAEWFQQEYDGDPMTIEDARARRRSIRHICQSLPAEVYSDILQGEIRLEDSDFLSCPEFFPASQLAH